MPELVRIIIFIVIGVILAILLFLLFFLTPIKRSLQKKNLAKLFYPKVMKVARDNDYYLINNLALDIGKKEPLLIHHLIAGDKFIYVITDVFYEGAVSTNKDDNRWIFYQKKGAKGSVPNPLKINEFSLETLSIQSGIAPSYLVGIVIVNNDCYENVQEGEEHLLVPVRNLEKEIASYEAKNVTPFVKSELWQTVKDLHDLSERNKEKKHG